MEGELGSGVWIGAQALENGQSGDVEVLALTSKLSLKKMPSACESAPFTRSVAQPEPMTASSMPTPVRVFIAQVLIVEMLRFDGVHKVTNCRQVFPRIYPKYRVVIAERKSQKPLLCRASPLVVSFGV